MQRRAGSPGCGEGSLRLPAPGRTDWRENKMLRSVLDSMTDSIAIKDLKGLYIFDNSAHCRFLGVTNTTEVAGKTLSDFLPAKSRPSFTPTILAYCSQVKQSFGLPTRQSTPPETRSGCRYIVCVCSYIAGSWPSAGNRRTKNGVRASTTLFCLTEN